MMNPAVYAARKVEKHARAAIDAATDVPVTILRFR